MLSGCKEQGPGVVLCEFTRDFPKQLPKRPSRPRAGPSKGMGCSRRCKAGCAQHLAGSPLSAWPRKLPRTKGELALVRSLGAEISGSFSQHIRARSRFPSLATDPAPPGPAAWLCRAGTLLWGRKATRLRQRVARRAITGKAF